MPSTGIGLAAELGLPTCLPPSILEIHVFGSYVRGTRTSDIDLLVIWDAEVATPLEAQDLRRALRTRPAAGLPLDIVLLTVREAEEADFVAVHRAELIYQRLDHK